MSEARGPAAIDLGVGVALLHFLSGGATLLLATAVLRAGAEQFGATAATHGAVVAGLLGCLALGALAFGARVDRLERPLRAFALLAAIAAVSACLGLLLAASRAGFAFDGVAAAAIGATLPLLAAVRAANASRPAAAGGLLAAGSLGAMAGAVVAGTIVLPAFGTRGTFALAAGVNGLVALVATWLARAEPRTEGAGANSTDSAIAAAPLVVAAFLSGFALLAVEFLLFRGIGQVTRGGQASGGMLLAAVLGASALGTAAGVRLARQHASLGFAASQLLALLAPLVALILLRALSHVGALGALDFGAEATTWQGRLAGGFVGALLVAGPVAFAAAIAFPCACELGRALHFGRLVGWLAGAVLLGAAVAALVAPALLPRLGLRDAVLAVALPPLGALIVVMAADRALRSARRLAGVGGALAAAAALLLLPVYGVSTLGDPLLFFRRVGGPGARLLAYHEDELANVAVVLRANGEKALARDDQLWKFAVGGVGAGRVEEMEGVLPALLHPAPKRALVLGVGAGVTIAALRALGCEEIDAVDPLPTVVEMLPWFAAENRGLVGDAKVHLHADDLRAFVRAAPAASYDVIVGDLFLPWEAEAGLLYARDHFERVKQLLKPGGLFCQWLPGHQLRWEELGLVGRTFTDVFDGATLWLARPDFAFPILGLVAGTERLELDVPAIAKRIEGHPAKAALTRLGVDDAKSFLSLYVADEWFFREKFDDRDINTSDRTRVEFLAARRIESEPVVALHNRRRLFEEHEDVVYRMNQGAVDKKELVKIKRELSGAAQSMWQLFDAQTSLLLATANRSLPEGARQNSPEELEAHAFQAIGAQMRERPDDGPAAELMLGLLTEQLRLHNFARVVEGVTTLENDPAIGVRVRLRYLRALAFLGAVCERDPAQAAQFTKPLEFAVKDLRKALELDSKMVEAEVNLGIALFLLGTKEADEEAQGVLAAAREKIVATDRPEQHGLPAPAEAVLAFLNGKREEAQRWLARPESAPFAAKLAERMH